VGNEHVLDLIEEAVTHRYSRRQILKRAAALGMAAPAINMVLAAASAAPAYAQAATSNPLKVDPKAPLDVVIFKGGFGDDYAKNVNSMYSKEFPDAKISYQGIQRLAQQLQPRFVGGNPPDIMDNSGAGNLDTAALVAQGQLADLDDLFAAPSYDTPGKTVAETLIPQSQGVGQYNGKQYVLEYAYTVYGVWYSSSLFKKNGWEYPQTWDDMMAMSEKIKASGTAPWTYQGKYPTYMQMLMDQFVYKNGGYQAIKNIDNLEPNAWSQDAVKNSLNALYELAQKGYIMKGTEGLTHTEAQAAWLQGKAVFIPCGTWLENEMKGLIPNGFDMVVSPTPALAGDKIPFTGINAYAGENFIVASHGKNPQGGKEWIRLLASKQAARFFSQNTKSLTVVVGSADGLDLGTAFASAQQVVKNAGTNLFYSMYGTWYTELGTEANNQMGELLNNRLTPAQYIQKVQKMADQVAKDSSIPKYKRS